MNEESEMDDIVDADQDNASEDTDEEQGEDYDASELLLLPLSSFDLLEGRFRKAARVRTMNLTVGLLSLVVLFVIVSRFAIATVQTGIAQGDADAAKDQITAVEKQLAEYRANGTATQADVDKYINTKVSILKAGTVSSLDWAVLLKDMESLGAGITVKTINVSQETEKAPTPTTRETGKDATTTTTAAKPKALQVTITGTAPNTSAIADLSTALRSGELLPYLNEEKAVAGTCKEGVCTWTWVAALDTEEANKRVAQIETDAKPAGAAIDTTTTTKGTGR